MVITVAQKPDIVSLFFSLLLVPTQVLFQLVVADPTAINHLMNKKIYDYRQYFLLGVFSPSHIEL